MKKIGFFLRGLLVDKISIGFHDLESFAQKEKEKKFEVQNQSLRRKSQKY